MNQIKSLLLVAAMLVTALPVLAQQKRVSPHETISSATGTFTFTDTNAPLFLKFYQLVLFP